MNPVFAGPIFSGWDILGLLFWLLLPFMLWGLIYAALRAKKSGKKRNLTLLIGVALLLSIPAIATIVYLVLIPVQRANDTETRINEYVSELPVMFLPADTPIDAVNFRGTAVFSTEDPTYDITYENITISAVANSETLQQRFLPDQSTNCDIVGAATSYIPTAEPTEAIPCQTEVIGNLTTVYSSTGQEYAYTYKRMAFIAGSSTFFSTTTDDPAEEAAFKEFAAQTLHHVDEAEIARYITHREKWSKEFE